MGGADVPDNPGSPQLGPDDFDALYAAHGRRVKAYFVRCGFSPADADDRTQEVFLRAFRSARTFDPARGAPGAWLAAIARNVARRHWSRPKPANFDPELAEEVFAAAQNPGDKPELREEIDAVRACVELLPPELAKVVRLRYVEARTTRGIAAAVNMPEATVRLRLAEAMGKLRQCLRGRGVLE